MYVARNELSRSLFFFSEKIQLEWNKSMILSFLFC